MAILCQHLTEEGRGKEAGVQMVAVFRHHPVQGIRSGLALLLAQQRKGNGADIFALPVRSNFPLSVKAARYAFTAFSAVSRYCAASSALPSACAISARSRPE